MKNLRIEVTDNGAAVYVAVDPDGIWARSTEPDRLVTVDWDAQGRVIGIETKGPAAAALVHGIRAALSQVDVASPDQLGEALDALFGGITANEHGAAAAS